MRRTFEELSENMVYGNENTKLEKKKILFEKVLREQLELYRETKKEQDFN